MDLLAGDASAIATIVMVIFGAILTLLLVLLCITVLGIRHRLDLATELLAQLVERTPLPVVLNRGNARPND